MKNWVVIIIVVIVLGVVGFYVFNDFIYNEKQGDTKEAVNTSETPPDKKVSSLQVTPISHATFVLNLGGQVIYNDPTGGGEAFAGQLAPDIILVSDIHGDHFDAPTLKEIIKDGTIIVVPQAVADLMTGDMSSEAVILKNGEKTVQNGIAIEAVAMYNMPESADAPHTKGRGNGYFVEADGKRVYIAGDTGATPEMRALKNIDVAFVPMNLPYTMSVDEAAEGVLVFKPKKVHPYHYRGQDGLADVDKFKELVEAGDANITVELLNFYPEE